MKYFNAIREFFAGLLWAHLDGNNFRVSARYAAYCFRKALNGENEWGGGNA
jgi:hypothetical protein